MSKTFKVWLDSGANVHSCNEQEVTLEELGFSDSEWESMTEYDREEVMRDIAFNDADWGYREVTGDDE